MKLTFGFDLGTNSIGWAVVNKEKEQIKGMGSVIFPMGVNLEKGVKEVSKNETRRDKRQARRQNFRRKIRKAKLAERLSEKGMFPDIDYLTEKYMPESKDLKFAYKFQRLIRQVPRCEELNDFFHLNPYELRAKAYNGEKLSKREIGRVIYQMGLRRGYRETLQDGDEKGAIYKGKPKENKTGIEETQEKIVEYGTLGNYLHNENPHQKRLRNRYTLRSMYTDEFNLIYKNQQKHYPELLDEDFYNELGFVHPTDPLLNGILFYQRPLRSQKHLLGNCQFESTKPVAPKSCPDFEKFRALTYATNIRCNGEPLSADDQQTVVDFLLAQKASKKFAQLRKKLSDPTAPYNYDDQEGLPASPTLSNLKSIFKKDWKRFSEKEVEDLWHLKYWAEDPDWLESKLREKYGLDDKSIGQFKKFRLPDGYANLSRKAIRAISEFMHKGFTYDSAVLLAGVKNAMGENWDQMPVETQSDLEDQIMEIAVEKGDGTSLARIKSFLLDHQGLSEKRLRKLYHHSFKEHKADKIHLPEPDNVRNPVVQQSLFVLRRLYNQLVDEYGQPHEVKIELARDLKGSKNERNDTRDRNRKQRDVNIAIKKTLDEYNQPHSRENIQKLQLYNELINTNGKAVNPFYPSQTFSIKDLFGSGAVQIEHIVPKSKSLNNSLGNKTLCDADTNRKKGNRTPYEYYKSIGADWEAIKKRIFKILPYQKAKRFIDEKNLDADDFISRQLNDTRYISRYAVTYLRQACDNVDIMQGTVSAMLRHYWGLDGILTPAYHLDVENGEYFVAINEKDEVAAYRHWDGSKIKKIEDELSKVGKVYNGNVLHGKFYPRKQRLDHRHHAIDALVVALAKKSHLQQLSTAHAKEVDFKELRRSNKHVVTPPWEGFWVQTKREVDNILVYHKQNNRVLTKIKKRLYNYDGSPKKINGEHVFAEGYAARGQLHKETVYGLHEYKNGERGYHLRKSIDFIKDNKHLATVVDPGIRQAITAHLASLGLDVYNPKGWKIADLDTETRNAVFFRKEENGAPVPQVFLPNRNGAPIPIKKVRVKVSFGNAQQLKNGVNQYVDPQNNHHAMIYANPEGELNEDMVTLWTAVKRARAKEPVYQTPEGCETLFSLEENDFFLLGLSDSEVLDWHQLDNHTLQDHLYRVQKISSGYYVFRKHTATTIKFDSEMKRIVSMSGLRKENPVKVRIDITGKIAPW